MIPDIQICNMRREAPSEPFDVRIDRGHSPLANTYYMQCEAQRNGVCSLYQDWFNRKLAEGNTEIRAELNRLLVVYGQSGRLRLFCWCAPKRCHAETIRNWLIYKLSE